MMAERQVMVDTVEELIEAFEEAGLEPDTRVRMRMPDGSMREILKFILSDDGEYIELSYKE